MRLFGKKAAAEPPRPALSRGASGVPAGQWPQSYEAQVRAAYCGNAIAQRAVRIVAEAVARAPLTASDPALARLLTPSLLEAAATQLLLHGKRLPGSTCCSPEPSRAVDATDPPTTSLPGQVWLLGTAPTGIWAGQAEALAGWTEGGWRFITATEGLRIRVKNTGLEAVYSNGSWQIGTVDAVQLRIGGNQVVGTRQPPIADPADGAIVDVNARVTIGQILGILRAHGLIATA